MITGEINDETLRGLAWVAGVDFLLTVCGSRYFGDATEASDFDFVVQDRPHLPEELLAGGFTERWDDTDKRYADGNTLTVFERGKVQVIVCESLKRRMQARDYIKAHGLDRKDTEVWENYYLEHHL